MKNRINQILQKEGITATLFAEKIGISPASLSHILNGRNEPSLAVVTKIHESCGVNLEWLIYGEGEMMVKPNKDGEVENGALQGDEIPFFSPIPQGNSENRKEIEPKTPYFTPKSVVNEEIRYIEKPERKITEIRIFFDNGTYETFHPNK